MKLYPIFESVLSESEVFEHIETLMGEDYPSSFNIDEFKSLPSFAARIRYCEQHLKRISSGSSRIVYKIDDEKVLKLAKNQKGLAQNEVEVGFSKEYMLEDVVARIFNYDQKDLWVEMELARKMRKADFKRITGLDWDLFTYVVHNAGQDQSGRGGFKYEISQEQSDEVWNNEFAYEILDFIGSFAVPAGDLRRTNSYGIVKRGGQDDIVLIDYGLTSDVYDSYYS